MYSESVYQVARSWVEVDSFHTRLVVRFTIFTASVRDILDTPRIAQVTLCVSLIDHVSCQKYIHLEGSPVATQTSAHWNLIGCSVITPPSVLSLNSILRLRNYHHAVSSPTDKYGACFENVIENCFFLHFIENVLSMKLCSLNVRKMR
jgi:hypothetical protein